MAVAGRNLTGRVAQLGSALPWHGRGPEFKSRHVHQIYTPITSHADTLSSIKNTDIKNIPTLSKQVTKIQNWIYFENIYYFQSECRICWINRLAKRGGLYSAEFHHSNEFFHNCNSFVQFLSDSLKLLRLFYQETEQMVSYINRTLFGVSYGP